MYLGQFSVQLGDKNRIAVPKKIREQLGSRAIISKGFEQSLIVIDLVGWDKLIANISNSKLLNLSTREIKRYLIASSFEIDLDKQGRFVLPEVLKGFARLQSNISIIGVGEWVEIWDEDSWNRKQDELATKVTDIANKLYENI